MIGSQDNELRIAANQSLPAAPDQNPMEEDVGSSELTGLAVGGFTAGAIFIKTLPIMARLNERATTFSEIIGTNLVGVLVISTIGALVGGTAVHLQNEFFPRDFPKDMPQQP